MKLRYKKIIILVTMFVMFIGMAFLTVFTTKDKDSTKVDKKEDKEVASEENKVEEVEPSATPDRTLKQNDDTQIVETIEDYLGASIECDMDTLSTVVSDPSLLVENEYKVKYADVEDFENLNIYTIDGLEEGSYLVYFYHELKIRDIDTLAPGLTRVYLVTGDDGKLKVFIGENAEVSALIADSDQTPEVQDLVSTVNKKLDEAASADEKLKTFLSNLTQATNNGTTADDNAQTQQTDGQQNAETQNADTQNAETQNADTQNAETQNTDTQNTEQSTQQNAE
ncbi:MAG: hypothetical protein K6G65_01065 [Lachnospiraceae bacterium]|nr:hypothetical protein [Lachnospiraceae bacterium]